jgi:protein-histidine pros-kinase
MTLLRLKESRHGAVLVIGGCVAALGALGLVGWRFNIVVLKSVLPGLAPMKVNTALGLLVCGTALAILSCENRSIIRRRSSGLLALLITFFGALSMSGYLFGWNLGVDQWLVTGASRQSGRMSLSSAFCFLLIGLSLLAISRGLSTRFRRSIPSAFGLTVIVVGLLALIGYSTDAVFNFRWWSYTGMAIHTAGGFIGLGLGLLGLANNERPEKWSLDGLMTCGFAAGILSLAAAAGLSCYFTNQLQKSAELVAHTQEVLKDIAEITSSIASMGSGQRSYINTGDVRFLEHEGALKDALYQQINSLRQLLTANNPGQKPLLDQLAALISERIEWGRETVEERQKAGLAEAERMIETGKGIAINDDIRHVATILQDEEYALLEQQQDKERAVSETTFLLLPLGLFLSVTLLSMGLFFLNAGLSEREEAVEKALWLGSFPEHNPSPIVELDLSNGVIYYQNPFAARLLPDLPALGLRHPWLAGLQEASLLLTAGADEPLRRETAINGRFYSQTVSYIPATKRVRVYGADITEQKRAQVELRTSEARLNFAMQASHTGAWELSLSDHKCARTLTHDRIFGYPRLLPLWTYEMFLDHVLLEDRPKVDGSFREAIASRGNWNFECRIRRNDGEIRWIWGAGGHERDAEGKAVRMAGVIQDITERKEIEGNAARLAAIVEGSRDAIIGIDLDAFVTSWNSSAERTFGYGAGEMIGRSVTKLIPPERQEEEIEIISRIKQGEIVKPFETVRVCKDGTELPVSISVSPIKDLTGKIIGASKVARDVTERRRVEKALRESHENLERNVAERTAQLQLAKERAEAAGRAKSEFMASMSHELRTPLNGIIGFSEFLVDGKPGPINVKQKEYLEDILHSGRHLLQLINDVLDLAKVEAGKIEFNAEPFPLRKAVAEVCSVAGPIAQKKRIEVGVSIAPELVEVRLDQMRFKQVVYNLLSNALKFTDQGGRVEIQCAPVGAHQFQLAVKDSGIGIKAHDLSRLFKEFEQIDSGTSRHYGGTGLGLALTRKMLEMQGGKIAVESEFGKGSTFTAVLPLNFVEERG